MTYSDPNFDFKVTILGGTPSAGGIGDKLTIIPGKPDEILPNIKIIGGTRNEVSNSKD